jgi:hypothetical protein
MAANLNNFWVICCYLTTLLPPLLVERETWLTLCTQVKFVRFWRTQLHTIESTYVIFFNEHAAMIDYALYIITLRIQTLSLVKSHDLLGDRRTELHHT